MAFWWVIMLLSSQVILMDHTVDATFDFSFRWLRDGSTVSTEDLNATAAAVTTGTTASRTTPPRPRHYRGCVAREEYANSRRRGLHGCPNFNLPGQLKVPTYSTTATTEATVPGATPVSLDDLALQIANVPDPILHVVEDRHGSPSFVIISGRHGSGGAATDATTTPTTTPSTDASTTPATTTLTTETTTSLTTTTPAAEARNTPPPSTTVFGSTLPAAPQHHFSVPGPAALPPAVNLWPLWRRPIDNQRNRGRPQLLLRPFLPFLPVPAIRPIQIQPPRKVHFPPRSQLLQVLPWYLPAQPSQPPRGPQMVLDEDLASYPAEFRVTELPGPFTTKDPLGNANATFHPNSPHYASTLHPRCCFRHDRNTDPNATEFLRLHHRCSRDNPGPHHRRTCERLPQGTSVYFIDHARPFGYQRSATAEVPTSAQTGAPGQLGSLVSRLTDESATMGGLDGVTFAPWPRTTAPKATGGGDDEPKYRYFYDPMQVMQIL
ncbi:hypothetical protein MRX96_022544 [Rhipicephalus microplus]